MDKLFCMKHRDWAGRPYFEIGPYEVTWHKDLPYPFKIIKREAWYRTNAYWADGLFEAVPGFASFIRACIFLKKHHKEFL